MECPYRGEVCILSVARFMIDALMDMLPPDFPVIGIVLIIGFIFSIFYAIFRGLFLFRAMRRLIKNLQTSGFVRVDGEASRSPWYIQRSWPLPVFFRFELRKEHHGNEGPASRVRTGALYIPVATSRTSEDVLRLLLKTESWVLRGEAMVTNVFLGWLQRVFPNPKHILESAGRITVYAPEILPTMLREHLPTSTTMIIRYGVSPRLTPEALRHIVEYIYTTIHQ